MLAAEKEAYFWSMCRTIYRKAKNGHVRTTAKQAKICMTCQKIQCTGGHHICQKCRTNISRLGKRASIAPSKLSAYRECLGGHGHD